MSPRVRTSALKQYLNVTDLASSRNTRRYLGLQCARQIANSSSRREFVLIP